MLLLLLEVCQAVTPSECLGQAKVLTGAETCAKRKSTSPRLFAIPASDRIAGLCNRLPNSKWEYANANFF